jgi:hypothetical protein
VVRRYGGGRWSSDNNVFIAFLFLFFLLSLGTPAKDMPLTDVATFL